MRSLLYSMSIKKRIPFKDGRLFITFTCYNWLPLFQITNGYDIVYKWFDYLKSKKHEINAFVVMPNHFHGLLNFRESDIPINRVVGEGKRLMGSNLISRLKTLEKSNTLEQMHEGVNLSDLIQGKHHQIWEDSFDWKHCYGEKFIMEKFNYIHNNPCKGKWNLARDITEYPHSSARFYYTGIHAAYPVTDLFCEISGFTGEII